MRRIVPILLPLACVAIIGMIASERTATAAPEGKIAVVDMLELINQHPDMKKLEAAYKQRDKDNADFLDRRKKSLEDLRKEIVKAAGAKQRQLTARFEKQAMWDEYDFKFKVQEARLAYVRDLESIYTGVRSLIKAYARRNGIVLVLQMTSKPGLTNADPNNFGAQVALRSVIYWDTPLDITAEIKKQYPKPPAPPAGRPAGN